MRYRFFPIIIAALITSCVSPSRFDEMKKEAEDISGHLKEQSSDKTVWFSGLKEDKLISLRNDLADILSKIIRHERKRIGDCTECDAEKNTLWAAEGILKLNQEAYEVASKELTQKWPTTTGWTWKDGIGRGNSRTVWNTCKVAIPVLWPWTVGEITVTTFIDLVTGWDTVVKGRPPLPPLDKKYVDLAEATKRDLANPAPKGTAKEHDENTEITLEYTLSGDDNQIGLWRSLVKDDHVLPGKIERTIRSDIVFETVWQEILQKVKAFEVPSAEEGIPSSVGAIKRITLKFSEGYGGGNIEAKALVFIPTPHREQFFTDIKKTASKDGYDLSAKVWQAETFSKE